MVANFIAFPKKTDFELDCLFALRRCDIINWSPFSFYVVLYHFLLPLT